jgi:RNA polymerase sigma factor (sigma-70 family)
VSGGTSVAEAPRMVADPTAADDQRLVAAVRSGDDRAFEALYGRYHRRITAYVFGMVKDHGRAEDVTQEIFVSALRRMRETARPIAFKPWIYEIAKNACIDQYRRSRRAEEISYDADDALAPNDYGRLVGSDPTPDAAVAAKQDLDHLCGAFGGLSDTHHEILVLRELEGLSYREIGERMGMSRPAVESTLFRARRRLTEEYDELVSGARCRRILGLIAIAADSVLGTRDSHRLARHVAHCQPCRREAIAAGLDSAILTHVPLHRRAAGKIAALLPFPWLARFARGGRGPADEATASMAGSGWAAHLPMLSDQVGAGWGKLAAVAAVLVAGLGAGVGTQVGADKQPAERDRAAVARSNSEQQPDADRAAAITARAATPAGERRHAERGSGRERTGRSSSRKEQRGGVADSNGGAGNGGGSGGSNPSGQGAPAAGGGDGASSHTSGGGGGGGGGTDLPAVKTPIETPEPVRPVVDGVRQTVDQTVQGVNNAVGGVNQTVNQTVNGVNQTVNQTVNGVNQTVNQTTQQLQDTTQPIQDTVNGLTGGLLPPP